jgi:esterase/lipase superfamily enzyme
MSIYDWVKEKTAEAGTQLAKLDPWHEELNNDAAAKQTAAKPVVVYGITNRPVSSDGKSLVDGRFSAPISATPNYFKETVDVSGNPGSFTSGPNGDVEIINKQEFDQGVAAQVKAAGGKLGIFTHGIRTAAGEAGPTGAVLASETGEPFVIEDWASTKATTLLAAHEEKEDDDTSFKSQSMINTSVEDLVKKYGAANIDMVAHSRGSMNQVRALADLQSKKLGSVNTATFAHSDVDVSDFELALPSFQNAAKHLNIIYNPQDNALRLSDIQRFGQVAKLDDAGGAIEESARLGQFGLTQGSGASSYEASKVPNYFSIAKDTKNDPIGHAFAPSLVASMISAPAAYTSFSRLKAVDSISPPPCPIVSRISGLGSLKNVISSIPAIPWHIVSAAKAAIDIVSDSPEVQKYMQAVGSENFAMIETQPING